MNRLEKLIREALSTPPKQDKCNCGCHDCDNVGNPGVVINESLNTSIIITENLRYHVENKLPLTENTFRYGSKSFLDLWAEARYLYLREAIHVNDLDKEILTETNLGEYGMFEGKRVPLDMPMLEEERYRSDERAPLDGEEEHGYIIKNTGINGSPEKWTTYLNPKTNELSALHRTYREPERPITYASDESEPGEDDILDGYVSHNGEPWAVYYNPQTKEYTRRHRVDHPINEADKKDPPIGKPKRGGAGGKKYYVYVRDPKTKNIKKVSFGDAGGLKAKINNPEARRAFAARHKCGTGEPKTSAKYWSCRLPRYAKALGINTTFTGFW